MHYEWLDAENTVLSATDGSHTVIIEPGHPDWLSTSTRKDISPYSPPPEPTQEELLAAERATWSCTRAQGKLAIGPEVWANVVAMADDPETPWGLKVAIYDTYEWRRLDPNIDALIWAMGLTPEEADDLFRLAMTL